jgi:hypothetical protein
VIKCLLEKKLIHLYLIRHAVSVDNCLISGVVVSPEEIKESVKILIEKKKKDLDSKRYQISGMLLGALRKEQPWANSLALKEELDAQICAYLGPKDERDDVKALVISFLR